MKSAVAITLLMLISVLGMAPQVKAQSPTAFEGIHIPTLLVSVGYSPQSMDNAYVDMLKSSGVSVVAIEADPVEVQAYAARYTSLMNYVHSQGMKVHFINQMDSASDLSAIGLYNPLQTFPPASYQKVHDQEVSWARWIAAAHPDIYSVIAEPSNLNIKMLTGFTKTQWTTIISDVAAAVKSVSPNTQTWADLIPASGIVDYNLGTTLISVSNLNGIGWDAYGQIRLNTAQPLMVNEVAGGKLVGLTETWWQDIYAHRSYDNPVYAANASAWFSYAYGNMAGNGTVPSVFVPFFTNDFVTLAPLPGPLSQYPAYFSTLQSALAQGNRTVVFYAYQSLVTGL